MRSVRFKKYALKKLMKKSKKSGLKELDIPINTNTLKQHSQVPSKLINNRQNKLR